MEYKDMATPDFQDRKKINAKYAGIVSRPLSRLNFPEADFFEILYFDNDDNQWHCGFGSYNFSFVSAWLKSEFEPTYNRLETAITDLLARAEAAEADRDRLREALKPNCILCDSMHENGNCTEVGGFCTAVPAAHCPLIPRLRDKLAAAEARAEKSKQCIYAIEDDLDRGNDNDWAREHIAEWKSQKEE